MQEYKREKNILESRLEDIEKRSVYHDDHIRITDAWLLQVRPPSLICGGPRLTYPGRPRAGAPLRGKDLYPTAFQRCARSPSVSRLLLTRRPEYPFASALHFHDSKDFQRHLGEKTKVVKDRIESLFSRVAASRGEVKPELAELEAQIRTLLASQKEYIVRVEQLTSEKQNVAAQLDEYTLKYFRAEKKLDRAKSASVQRLEQQALASATARPPSNGENGSGGEPNADFDALQLQYQEAAAASARQGEQLEAAFAEIKDLQEQNSTFKAQRESLTDENYSQTEVFKVFRNQNEDLIKRINHLEATNKLLREEAEKYQSERTAFRVQLELEAQAVTGDLEDQIAAKEADLTRIRSTRDELMAELGVRKATQEQEQAAYEHIKELVGAKDDRQAALELELERLRPAEDVVMSTPREELEGLATEQLQERYLKLEKDLALIQQEVPAVERAYRRAISLAQKKVIDFAALDEKTKLLAMEKAKADQKYFAARKDMDIRINEVRQLRNQNSKSSEIIVSLKEVESQSRTLVSNLEKQLADFRRTNTAVMEENRLLKASSADAARRCESSKVQISDLTNLLKTKDAAFAGMKEHHASREVECEKLRVRLDNMQKERDNWKAKSLANSSEEEEMLRVSTDPSTTAPLRFC